MALHTVRVGNSRGDCAAQSYCGSTTSPARSTQPTPGACSSKPVVKTRRQGMGRGAFQQAIAKARPQANWRGFSVEAFEGKRNGGGSRARCGSSASTPPGQQRSTRPRGALPRRDGPLPAHGRHCGPDQHRRDYPLQWVHLQGRRARSRSTTFAPWTKPVWCAAWAY
jgi:hypothetical protein